jgi:hypothetical protein
LRQLDTPEHPIRALLAANTSRLNDTCEDVARLKTEAIRPEKLVPINECLRLHEERIGKIEQRRQGESLNTRITLLSREQGEIAKRVNVMQKDLTDLNTTSGTERNRIKALEDHLVTRDSKDRLLVCERDIKQAAVSFDASTAAVRKEINDLHSAVPRAGDLEKLQAYDKRITGLERNQAPIEVQKRLDNFDKRMHEPQESDKRKEQASTNLELAYSSEAAMLKADTQQKLSRLDERVRKLEGNDKGKHQAYAELKKYADEGVASKVRQALEEKDVAIQNRIDDAVNRRVTAVLGEDDTKAQKHIDEVLVERMAEAPRGLEEKARKRADKLFAKQLEELKAANEAKLDRMVQQAVESRVHGIKAMLEEQVKNRVQDIEDDFNDRLEKRTREITAGFDVQLSNLSASMAEMENTVRQDERDKTVKDLFSVPPPNKWLSYARQTNAKDPTPPPTTDQSVPRESEPVQSTSLINVNLQFGRRPSQEHDVPPTDAPQSKQNLDGSNTQSKSVGTAPTIPSSGAARPIATASHRWKGWVSAEEKELEDLEESRKAFSAPQIKERCPRKPRESSATADGMSGTPRPGSAASGAATPQAPEQAYNIRQSGRKRTMPADLVSWENVRLEGDRSTRKKQKWTHAPG